MSTVLFKLDEDVGFDRLQAKMQEMGSGSGQLVDEVLHGEGAEVIRKNIKMILPVSGRKWKGKKPAAKVAAAPFKQEDGKLSVTTKTQRNYHYLYFPDDGHTTLKHAGNQQFMLHGAENSAEKIIDMCVSKIVQELEG